MRVRIRLDTGAAVNNTSSFVVPEDGFIDWIDLQLSVLVDPSYTPNIESDGFLSFSDAQYSDNEFARITVTAVRPATTDPAYGLSAGKFMKGLGIPVTAGTVIWIHGSNQAGSTSRFFVIIGFLRNLGHVSQVTRHVKARPRISFRPENPNQFETRVVTLKVARAAALAGLDQLIAAGDTIVKHAELWDRVVLGFADEAKPSPFPELANELDAALLLQLLTGYYGQGFRYIENNLGGFGKFRLRGGKKLEDVYPDFAMLLEDPIGLIERLLFAWALRQDKPRHWITAHFRSRAVPPGVGQPLENPSGYR